MATAEASSQDETLPEDDRIRRGRKFDQVLDGARTVFLRDGFEGASVDDIARVAGVSKATLYSYFPDKRLMFVEMVRTECLRHADDAEALIDQSLPAADVLRAGARRMVELLLAEVNLRIFRICVAEADRFPELAAAYYDSGPMLARRRLCTYFAEAAARGELAIADPELAADQFAELCKADLFTRALFGVGPPATAAEIARVAEGAAMTFLTRYGTPLSRGATPQ